MEKIKDINEFKEILQKENVVLFFTANWCFDCTFIKPSLPLIIEENKDFSFYEVDRDLFLDECIALEILGIPSFIIFSKGQEVIRFVSKMRKTKIEIDKFIEEGRILLNAKKN